MAAAIEEAAFEPTEQATKAEEARARLAELRKALADFHRERARTREMVEGRRKSRFGPIFAAEAVTAHRRRNAGQERQAAEQLRNLMRLALGREPQIAELVAPPEVDSEALGALPLLPLAAVAGGAFALVGLFVWLTAQEREAQRAAGMQPTWGERAAQVAPFAAPLLLAGAVGVGGWALWREVRGESVLEPAKRLLGKKGAGGKKRKRNPAPKPWQKPWEDDEPDDVDEDDDAEDGDEE